MLTLHSKTINIPSEILHRQSDGVIILRAVPMIFNIEDEHGRLTLAVQRTCIYDFSTTLTRAWTFCEILLSATI